MNTYIQIMESAARYIADARPSCGMPEDVVRILRPVTRELDTEHVFVLSLDTKYGLLSLDDIAAGTANSCSVHARDIFRAALRANAVIVVLAHNHPTGNPAPSSPDIMLTEQARDAGKIVGIPVVDHIVVGTRTPERSIDYVSMRREKLVDFSK